MKTNAEAVRDGIALLNDETNNRVPANWIWAINPDYLDISNPTHCVLGQLFGGHFGNGYVRGADILELDDPSEYGFNVSNVDVSSYHTLTHLWRNAIRRLRDQEVSA